MMLILIIKKKCGGTLLIIMIVLSLITKMQDGRNLRLQKYKIKNKMKLIMETKVIGDSLKLKN